MRFPLYDLVLLSRPYSVANIIALSLVASIYSRGPIFDTFTILDVFFSVSLWSGLIYLSEFIQKDKNRPRIYIVLPLIFLLICSLIAIFRNYVVLVLIGIGVVSTILYSTKKMNWVGSPFVFLFRGVVEVAIFFGILFFYPSTPIPFFTLILPIYLLTLSRNLIGDIRDADFDKYTLVKKTSQLFAKAVSFFCLSIGIFLTGSLVLSFPLVVIAIGIVVINNAFFLHKWYVIATTFFFLNLLAGFFGWGAGLLNLGFLLVTLNSTYRMVKRKSNQLGVQY